MLDDDSERIDFERVHSWMTTSYWTPGIDMARVRKAAEGSAMLVGAYLGEEQVGYARVVSDRTSFSWIADVFVDPAHRRKGLAKAIVRFAIDHPDYQPMRRWVLATRDAHSVYAELGFTPIENPENWMILRGEPVAPGSP
jgi:GNAT superfamily N-acetyltransferase